MLQKPKVPEGEVADAVKGNWVDHRAPVWTRPYLRLSRADRPIGTWLLFIPCIWGVLLAALHGGDLQLRDLWLIIGCGAGAWLMRGAGCTWNDISDRDFDAKVARTRSRPLPSGQVTVLGAYVWMALQTAIAAAILFSFGPFVTVVGLCSLVFVAIYPFAKRFTWWPQVFLGLAFNWGALLGWSAHSGTLELPAFYLYLAGIAWTLFYDTIYAHQDTEDDALIGVKSTARLFGEKTPLWLMRFMVAVFVLMVLAILAVSAPVYLKIIALLAPAGLCLHLIWQMGRLDIHDAAILLQVFRNNRDAGLIAGFFFFIAALVRLIA